MKSSQSNFVLRSPSSYLVRSYLIATVPEHNYFRPHLGTQNSFLANGNGVYFALFI